MARCMDDLELACRVSFGARGATNRDDVKLPKKLRFGYYASGVFDFKSPSPAYDLAMSRWCHKSISGMYSHCSMR
ncbi:hypothetical protein B0H10DRAFT_2000664 [Mycena sp. CBHHK59/15]|nr:hypothetical protein B0H10DRAFT_2000664 [Mycena sp. CBHHK59/15]